VDLLDMQARVSAALEYLDAVRVALVQLHKQGRTRQPPEGVPDFFNAAGLGSAQVEQEVSALRRLLARLKSDYEQATSDHDDGGSGFL
jgi:hypothetical protein